MLQEHDILRFVAFWDSDTLFSENLAELICLWCVYAIIIRVSIFFLEIPDDFIQTLSAEKCTLPWLWPP